MTAAITRLSSLPAKGFEYRGRAIAAGRSLLALAQLSVLFFTPDRILFAGQVEPLGAVRCDAIRSITFWCISGNGPEALTWSRFLSIGILGVVASGFSPRWTCIPHWYVTFSIASTIVPLNGGDKVAQVATMLLVPVCLGDGRRWQWTSPVAALTPRWQGAALAALAILRVQLAIIYVTAVMSKLFDHTWRDGSVFAIIVSSQSFGPDPGIRNLLQPILAEAWLVLAGAWLVMVLQGTIAVLIFVNQRARLIASALGIAFHVGIIVVLRMPSFSVVMIGVLLIACAEWKSADSLLNRMPMKPASNSVKYSRI